jgi:ribosomal-protein-alanine N-acetyltransferase
MRQDTVPDPGLAGYFLRPLSPADIDDWYAYLADPAAIEHTSWSLRGPGDLAPLIDEYNGAVPGSQIRFAIHGERLDRLVGTIGFHTISPANKTAEIAYDLHPALWGQGVISACVKAATGWAVTQHAYGCIEAMVLDTNRPSMRVLEKCGFQYEETLRRYRQVRGQPRDYARYAWLPR